MSATRVWRRRWINAATRRYDQIELVRDLPGDWTMVQCWVGIAVRAAVRFRNLLLEQP